MRRTDPLILGAGPAGCAAAITLAQAGATPVLLDRSALAGDALCGGFLSWQTAAQLKQLGIDPDALGAHRVKRLAIFAGGASAELPLPGPAHGLSRRALDTALRTRALALGVAVTAQRVRRIAPGVVSTDEGDWSADSIFLATGKHDLQGAARPRETDDPMLGVRLVLAASPALAELVAGRIELHLFAGGYAGLVMQEGGRINLCAAVRKSRLAAAGKDPAMLIAKLADASPALAARLDAATGSGAPDAIGAIPYGWTARDTAAGLFRLGDQAAVIPSLAGEGIGLALASGAMAAEAWLTGGAGAAPSFQRGFARKARRPLAVAGLLRAQSERPYGATLVVHIARHAPALIRLAARLTRLD